MSEGSRFHLFVELLDPKSGGHGVVRIGHFREVGQSIGDDLDADSGKHDPLEVIRGQGECGIFK